MVIKNQYKYSTWIKESIRGLIESDERLSPQPEIFSRRIKVKERLTSVIEYTHPDKDILCRHVAYLLDRDQKNSHPGGPRPITITEIYEEHNLVIIKTYKSSYCGD